MASRYIELSRIQTPEAIHGIIQRLPDGRQFTWEAPLDGSDRLIVVHTLIKQLEDDLNDRRDNQT